MRKMTLLGATAMLALALLLPAASAQAQDAMQVMKDTVAKYAGKKDKWDGPTAGPAAATGKKVVFLGGDMKNGGIVGAANGATEAAKVLGWDLRIIDGQGTVSGRTAAFGQAIALKADGIIIGGFDTAEQKVGMDAANAAGIPIIAWHSGTIVGPNKEAGIYANVTTDPMQVSEAAALWAMVDGAGKPGAIIFTDSTYAIAVAKARKMEAVIKASGGTVLEFVDTPIADTSTRMPQLTTTLLQRYGAKWTHSLAINDLYFDFMGPSLSAAGLKGDARPTQVSAGDGSESAYQRVRTKAFQAVTVAEPLNLQGWQTIDELNRAFAKAPWSGYVTPIQVVTPDNIAFDGGPKNNFDPDNGYRDQYKKMWGK